MVGSRAPRRAIEQCLVGKPLTDEAPHGSHQPFGGPGPRSAAPVQDANHRRPGMIRPELSDDRQPSGSGQIELGEIRRIANGGGAADRLRLSCAESGIAADTASGLGCPQARLRPLPDERPLEFGRGTEHLHGELALRARRVNGIMQRTEVRSPALQVLDHLEKMRERARQPVDAHDHEHVRSSQPMQQLGQFGTRTVRSRGLLFKDFSASRGAQLVLLGIGGLLLGRDPGIADDRHLPLLLRPIRRIVHLHR